MVYSKKRSLEVSLKLTCNLELIMERYKSIWMRMNVKFPSGIWNQRRREIYIKDPAIWFWQQRNPKWTLQSGLPKSWILKSSLYFRHLYAIFLGTTRFLRSMTSAVWWAIKRTTTTTWSSVFAADGTITLQTYVALTLSVLSVQEITQVRSVLFLEIKFSPRTISVHHTPKSDAC